MSHLDLRRARIGTGQALCHPGDLTGRRQIAFGEQQAVGHRHLPDGLDMTSQLLLGVRDVDRRDHPVDAKARGNEEVFEQRG